jgi:AraC family transcriptional regulator, arabinose operon regulatory protein
MKESPHPSVDFLISGDFHCGSDYRNFRSRGTDDWLIIFTVDGAGRVATENTEVFSTRGTVTLYQPGTQHIYITDPGVGHWHLLWSHFHPRPQWRIWLNWPEKARGFRTLVLRDKTLIKNVSTAFRDSVRWSRQNLPGSIELAANALERAILWINSANMHRDLDDRVRKALGILAERLHEPFSLPKLARECGLSVSRLAHLFQKQMGSSPQKYQEQLRLRWARQLLHTSSISISEIATNLGYANAFYFSKRFKLHSGISPSEYRYGRKR